MQTNPASNSNLGNRLASYLAVKRKKAAVAVCLIAVMCFMWARLLMGTGEPASAAAATKTDASRPAGKAVPATIAYVAPPFVAGRNDTLKTDFFSPGDWRAFLSRDCGDNQGQVLERGEESAAGESRAAAIRRAAETLRLQIIETGSRPQAFISDTLVTEGSTFVVPVAEEHLEFRVLRLMPDGVKIQCENMTFEIRLKEQ
jgi:hypothetical protein